MKHTSALFLEKIPKKTVQEIELWYKISLLMLFFLCLSLSLFTAKQYYSLYSHQKEFALKNTEGTGPALFDTADQQAEFSPEMIELRNKKFFDSFLLICSTIPDEIILSNLLYTNTQTLLKGSCSSTEIMSNYTQALTHNNFYTQSKVLKLEKKDPDFIFEIMLF